MQNECPNLSLNPNYYSFHHLFAAGEEDEDEKPLKSVQHKEDVPLKTSRVTLTVISTLQHQRLEKGCQSHQTGSTSKLPASKPAAQLRPIKVASRK